MMRRLLLQTVGASALLGAAMTCITCGSFSGSSDATPSEAGGGDAGRETPPRDGGSDDAELVDEAGCALFVLADFSDTSQGWTLEGAVTIDGGSASLAGPNGDLTAAVYIAVPAPPVKGFKASFTLNVPNANESDGITLAWASNPPGTPPIRGDHSASVGFCPLSGSVGAPVGSALDLDFYLKTLSFLTSDGGTCTMTPATNETYQTTQQISVYVTDTTVTGSIVAGSNTTPFGVSIAGGSATDWIGFTAATGGGTGTFTIDNVALKLCR